MSEQANCFMMSMEEKRKLVYELATQDGDPETLVSWSRHDILQLLCAEMGKERKYTGLTKLKIIENLFKIVCEKLPNQIAPKVTQQPILDSSVPTPISSVMQCKNSACKASLTPGDLFCKRCSCCICRKFDDNKDPSLWLTCTSEPPFEGDSCNMSCHLDCAFKHERSGLSAKGQVSQLDGSFYCVSCGKMNDLLKCWRKQLMIAKDTRRADILCYRVSLTQKLLNGTNKYRNLSEIVDEAVNKLQAEVGPLTDITVKMGRGIVNRMSSGHQVQRLCTSAVSLIDSILSATTPHSVTNTADQDSRSIRFGDVTDTSVSVILGPINQVAASGKLYTMWFRKAVDEKEPSEPTCKRLPAGTGFVIDGLTPSTEYIFKVVSSDSCNESSSYETRLSTAQEIVSPDEIEIETETETSSERSQSPVVTNSTLSNPSSVEDETNNITSDLNDKKITQDPPINAPSLHPENSLFKPPTAGLEIVPCPAPDKDEKNNAEHKGSSSQKRKREGEKDMEFYVKVFRRLECEGHIDKSFRKKLLTWYMLRATPYETEVLHAYVAAFADSLDSLAGQIIHTFGDFVLCRKSEEAKNPPALCMKLWH